MPHRSAASPDGRARVILVVEDETLIALDLTDILCECGFEVLGPAATVTAALTLIGRRRPDAAILDINLRHELVTPVALILDALSVPFMVSTACDPAMLPKEGILAAAPTLSKPASPVRVVSVLTDLLVRADAADGGLH